MNNMVMKLKHVSYYSISGKKNILDNISFDIEKGDFLVIIGPNGSGKSSLIKVLSREVTYDTGHIFFEDRLIESYKQKDYYKKIMAVSQNIRDNLFENLTIYENFLVYLRDDFKSKYVMFSDILDSVNENLVKKENILVKNLSGGEKQSLALSLVFTNSPKILLLDEHTSALDPKIADRLMELTAYMLNKNKVTCIMVTHNLDYALQYSNKICALQEGKVLHFFNKTDKISKKDLLKYCF